MRISLDITQEQHNALLAMSENAGQSVSDYVINYLFTSHLSQDRDIERLENFLSSRLTEVGVTGNNISVSQIFAEVAETA